MERLTISLSDGTARRIKEVAAQQGVSPEEYVEGALERALAKPASDAPIEDIGKYLVQKNAELYRRLG